MSNGDILALDAAVADRLFPFHVVLASDLRVLRVAPVIKRLLPALVPGQYLEHVFEAIRPLTPLTPETIGQLTNTLLILKSRQPPALVVKGQIAPLAADGRMLLLVSPRIADADEMLRLGLTAADFALHDPASEMLVVLQAMRASLMDAELLAKRLRQTRDEALQASKAKSQFLANMSHELRTPLNAIIGFTEMMAAQMHGPLPAKYIDYLGDVKLSGQHLLDLINDLLDLARIEADRFELRPSQFAVGALVEECVRTVTPQTRKKGLTVEIASFDPSLTIDADERAVRQIVLNLLSNAVKFSRQAGRIDIGIVRDPTSHVRISVADNGEGIDPATMRSIFEPFRRGDHRVSDAGGGTGLGLHIAKRLAGLHGGTISIKSRPGEGTTVALLLPAVRVVAVSAPGRQKAP
ncbi:MAG: HAMP domain-containing histidine kinase [Alphaproteobacteria bacterium]|nr:HAMP domain-containing histidine kinase [Alphaproteobacteria bacterium]